MKHKDTTHYIQENQTFKMPFDDHVENYALFDANYVKKCGNNCISIKENTCLEINNLKHGKYLLTSLSNNKSTTIIVLPTIESQLKQKLMDVLNQPTFIVYLHIFVQKKQ